jgi:hypothetical protein
MEACILPLALKGDDERMHGGQLRYLAVVFRAATNTIMMLSASCIGDLLSA